MRCYLFLRLQRLSKILRLLKHKTSSTRTYLNRHSVSAAKEKRRLEPICKVQRTIRQRLAISTTDYYCTFSLATNRQPGNSLWNPQLVYYRQHLLLPVPPGQETQTVRAPIGDLCLLLKTYRLRRAADNFLLIKFSPLCSSRDTNGLPLINMAYTIPYSNTVSMDWSGMIVSRLLNLLRRHAATKSAIVMPISVVKAHRYPTGSRDLDTHDKNSSTNPNSALSLHQTSLSSRSHSLSPYFFRHYSFASWLPTTTPNLP